MTHDQLLDTLVDAGTPRALPAEARRHLETCEECRALASALEILADQPEAVAVAPPAGYWDTFDQRLAARLQAPESATGSASPARSGATVLRLRRTSGGLLLPLARLAAALVLVLAGWAALRGGPAPLPDDPAALASGAVSEDTLTRVAIVAPDTLTDEADALAGGWSDSWSTPEDAWSLATTTDSDEWSDLLVDPLAPVDAVDAELGARLTDEQAAELARRLRQEMSS